MDWLGWDQATPLERAYALSGGVLFLGAYFAIKAALTALFGWAWRHLPRRAKAKGTARKRRR